MKTPLKVTNYNFLLIIPNSWFVVRWDPNRIYLSVATPPRPTPATTVNNNSNNNIAVVGQKNGTKGKGVRRMVDGSPTRTAPIPWEKDWSGRSAPLSSAPLRSGTTYRVVALNSIRLLPPLHRPQSRAAATTPCSLLKPSAPLPWLRLPSSSPGILGELLRKCFLCVSVWKLLQKRRNNKGNRRRACDRTEVPGWRWGELRGVAWGSVVRGVVGQGEVPTGKWDSDMSLMQLWSDKWIMYARGIGPNWSWSSSSPFPWLQFVYLSIAHRNRLKVQYSLSFTIKATYVGWIKDCNEFNALFRPILKNLVQVLACVCTEHRWVMNWLIIKTKFWST